MKSNFLSRSSKSFADPLSEVLSLLKPHRSMSVGLDAGGDWSFEFEPSHCFLCLALVSGHCWISIEGTDEPVRLESGDFVAIPHGPRFRLASDPSIEPIDIRSAVAEPLNGHILSWQGGGACLGLTAFFTFAAEHANLLLELLPPLVHLREAEDCDVLQWYLERMMAVLRIPQPGGELLGEHLAQMMLIEVLRLQVNRKEPQDIGWLSAISDRQLHSALSAMHGDPGHRWTLGGLAERAAMSRSAFALRFKTKVGISAMEYLTRWRMLLAADRIVNSEDSISTISRALGYESESAFSFAFKREMGCSPRQYSQNRS